MSPEKDSVSKIINAHKGRGSSLGFGGGIDPLGDIKHVATVRGPSVIVPTEKGNVYINGQTMVFITDKGSVAVTAANQYDISLEEIKELFPIDEYRKIRKAVNKNRRERERSKKIRKK